MGHIPRYAPLDDPSRLTLHPSTVACRRRSTSAVLSASHSLRLSARSDESEAFRQPHSPLAHPQSDGRFAACVVRRLSRAAARTARTKELESGGSQVRRRETTRLQFMSDSTKLSAAAENHQARQARSGRLQHLGSGSSYTRSLHHSRLARRSQYRQSSLSSRS